MHSLRRVAFAAPRQFPLRAAPRASSWQPVARLYSSEAAADQKTPSPAESKTESKAETKNGSKDESSDSAKLTPAEQARMKKSINSSLNNYKKMGYNANGNNGNNGNTAQSSTASKNTPAPKAAPAANGQKTPTLGNTQMETGPTRKPGYAMDIRQIDWSSEYYGASAYPVTEKQYLQLTQPLNPEDVEVKPDGVIYLPEIKYRRKLNQVFGPMGWSLIPRGEPVVGQNIVTREYVLVADSRFVSQAQGENNYFNADQLPSAVEGCKSNALMRCCKDLGIASELWDPNFVRSFRQQHMTDVWVEHAVTKKKRTLWFKKGSVEYVYPWKKSGGS